MLWPFTADFNFFWNYKTLVQNNRSSDFFHYDTRSTEQGIYYELFRIGCGYCKGSNRKKCGQKNEGCADLSSSVLGWWPCESVHCAVAWLLLSIPRLFYAQLPSSSSTSPPGLISSFVPSPINHTHLLTKLPKQACMCATQFGFTDEIQVTKTEETSALFINT